MPSSEHAMTTTEPQVPAQAARIVTTLYDLIAALNEEIEAGEEDVAIAAVAHLCNTGRLRFLDDPRKIEIDHSGL